MAKIHVLEKHLAELIAAGEVVERPASVVKELLENAIDAGATQVTVAIESGGIRLIEISDNGSGIEAEYIPTAFIRHATSKIQTEDDLNSIATLGFRGEALASIASVARVEVLTKTEQDEFACCYRIEGGETFDLEVSARAVGTTIRVRDLFYNTPARMKFLKKDASEGTFVADLVSHVALSHPEISFKFVREGKLQYVTPGDDDLQSAAYAVLGREFARDLVKVADRTEQYAVHGYVSPPKSCRASRSMQYFYINGRYVKNRTMMAALETAYKGSLMHGKFPGCVLSLQMPTDMIDVNAHPAKTEVRFAREKDVFDAVYRAVKGALAQANSDVRLYSFGGADEAAKAATTPFDVAKHSDATSAPAYAATQAKPATQATKQPSYFVGVADILTTEFDKLNQATPQTSAAVSSQTSAVVPSQASRCVAADAPIAPRVQVNSPVSDTPAHGLEQAYQEALGDIVGMPPAFEPTKMSDAMLDIRPEEEPVAVSVAAPVLEPVVEPEIAAEPEAVTVPVAAAEPEATAEPEAVAQTSLYPVEETAPLVYLGEAFKTYIIAQQGETVCFIDKHAAHERMLYEKLVASYGNVASQMLLEAIAVNLSAGEKQALLENQDLLEQAGLEVEEFGGTTVLVRAVPADVAVSDVEDLTVELAAKLASGSRDVRSEKTQWVLSSISCRAAIKAGDQDATQQLMHLAQKILSGEIPPYCPHGRPCMITLTRKELEKQFGRIV